MSMEASVAKHLRIVAYPVQEFLVLGEKCIVKRADPFHPQSGVRSAVKLHQRLLGQATDCF